MGLPEGSIPEEKLPQCWSDDVRMNALFAPFRIKTANPESWEMKMKFWSDLMRVWCRCRQDPVVSAADAKFAFQRKARTPACIDIVVEEMYRNGDLSPISKYHQILHNGPEGWVRWGARLAFKPAAFALTAVSSFLPGRQAVDNDGLPKASIESTQRFVLESAVKEQASDLLNSFPGEERLGTVEELMRQCDWQRSKETFELLLGCLIAQGTAVKKGDVIKIAEPNKNVLPISDTDEALARLICTETRLSADEARLSRDVASAVNDARAAMKLGNKLVAKNHLRRKHKVEQRLTRCTGALDNVRQLLQQCRDARHNADIVDTYRTTSEAMKRNMKDNDIDEESVFDTMDELKEVMDSYNEIEKALGANVEEVDVAELEEELQELLAAPPGGGDAGTPDKPRRKEALPSLPSPPRAPLRPRKESDREFVFDGEERVLAELNDLDLDDKERPPEPAGGPRPWAPRAERWPRDMGYEVRQDERLHPGQTLNVDYTRPPRLYNTDFTVQDHRLDSGVWLYRAADGNGNGNDNGNGDQLAHSTEYFSSESPGKVPSAFSMAPGGERSKSPKRPAPALD